MGEQVVSVKVTIDRPRQVVWDFLTTPGNWQKWYVASLLAVTPGWQKGATADFGPGTRPVIEECLPPELLQWGKGTFWRLSDRGGSSTELEMGTTARGLMADDPLLFADFKAGWAKNVSLLEKLKALIEA
jgi:uncharacterized protein YndB with AHSA1/START domain